MDTALAGRWIRGCLDRDFRSCPRFGPPAIAGTLLDDLLAPSCAEAEYIVDPQARNDLRLTHYTVTCRYLNGLNINAWRNDWDEDCQVFEPRDTFRPQRFGDV